MWQKELNLMATYLLSNLQSILLFPAHFFPVYFFLLGFWVIHNKSFMQNLQYLFPKLRATLRVIS